MDFAQKDKASAKVLIRLPPGRHPVCQVIQTWYRASIRLLFGYVIVKKYAIEIAK